MNVTAIPVGNSDGTIKRQFTTCINSQQSTYTYETEQDNLAVWNKGTVPVILNVGSYTNQTIQPQETWVNDVIYASFTLQTSSGFSEVQITSKEYDNVYVKKNSLDSQLNDIANYNKTWAANNLMKSKGIALEEAAIVEDWLKSSFVPTGERNTSEKVLESGSLMFSFGTVGPRWVTKAINYDFTNINKIMFMVYVEDCYKLSTFNVSLSTVSGDANANTAWTNYFKSPDIYASTTLQTGWNCILLHKDDFILTGSATWGTFRAIRFNMVSPTNKYNLNWSDSGIPTGTTTFGIGGIYLNPTFEKPMVLVNFDDSLSSMYTNCFPYMRTKGIPGTLFVCYDHVADNGGPGAMTIAQHQTLYDCGWDMCNHSRTHPDFTALTDQQAYTELNDCLQFLLVNGWTRGAYINAYPQNNFTLNTIRVANKVGCKMTRGVRLKNINYITGDELMQVPTYEIRNNTTLATMTGWIDKAIKYGTSISIFTHTAVASSPDAYSMLLSDFQSLIDYIVTKRDAGLIEPATWSQLYNKLSNVVPTIR